MILPQIARAVIKDSSVNETKSIVCDQNYDSLLLKYADEFTPTTIDLNSSLSSDLKSFLLSVDTNCLRKQTEYRYFIALILEKLALYHLKCCNQHYDLYQMREGAAAVIINEFNKLAGNEGKRLEMLNSGLITDYINSDKTLSTNPAIINVMKAIESESKRIGKGI
ncbi:MAG: hypothetical protein WDO16_26035 [Bacteroidota bacterium]